MDLFPCAYKKVVLLALLPLGTYQGYADNSTWTRGQAWAIYGYVMIYRYLQEPKFLERSLACLK